MQVLKQISPLDGWVAVEPIDPNEEVKTDSGLILTNAESQKEKQKNLGRVIAIPQESPVSEGCMVCYKGYAGQEVWLQEKRYLLIEFQDLCGVLS